MFNSHIGFESNFKRLGYHRVKWCPVLTRLTQDEVAAHAQMSSLRLLVAPIPSVQHSQRLGGAAVDSRRWCHIDIALFCHTRSRPLAIGGDLSK
jgi:hypothetical protein